MGEAKKGDIVQYNQYVTQYSLGEDTDSGFGQRIVARADWLWQGRHVIDAKLGQSVNLGQLGHFLRFAIENGGTVTYITLTRTPPAVIQKATDLGAKQGVAVNFISLLPF